MMETLALFFSALFAFCFSVHFNVFGIRHGLYELLISFASGKRIATYITKITTTRSPTTTTSRLMWLAALLLNLGTVIVSAIFLYRQVQFGISHDMLASEWISQNPSEVLPTVLVFSLVLYYMRGRYIFWYGLIEILVANAILWFSITAPDQKLLPRTIGIVGGIYIMVRGLDNIARGLRGRVRAWWDRWLLGGS